MLESLGAVLREVAAPVVGSAKVDGLTKLVDAGFRLKVGRAAEVPGVRDVDC